MNSRLYRAAATRATSGSASSIQVLHLLLRPTLKKHENKDHKGQAAELAKCRVFVSVPTVQRERNVLYEDSRPVDDGADDSKLNAHLEESVPFGLGPVQFWCKIVNKSGDQKRKYEAKDANPRDSQSLDQIICHLICIKEKSLL
jgi:hypothetical protein